MTARIAGHTVEGLRRLLQHQQDDLFSLPEDHWRAPELEKEIVKTRKLIRSTIMEELEDECANSKQF